MSVLHLAATKKHGSCAEQAGTECSRLLGYHQGLPSKQMFGSRNSFADH